MSFLNAEWRKLAIANYVVDPNILMPYVPNGTELDIYEDKCYVSLVAFKFVNTKVLGLKIPFHVNFEEANLRFYVKRLENGEWKRGVVFIKEIVPKFMISLIANLVYKEHYQTMPMDHIWAEQDGKRLVQYTWGKRQSPHSILLRTSKNVIDAPLDPETEFITEHYWGYTKAGSKTFAYQVTHPKWKRYQVYEYEINIDFAQIYGDEFAILNGQDPASIMLAEGSPIAVEKRKRIH